jgi:AcrR family transcriptional regulator
MNTITPPENKPKQARSGQTQQKILRATARVINEFGLENATLEKITLESGITTGAIYFHFKNRDALMERLETEARNLFYQIIEGSLKKDQGQFSNIVSASRALGEYISKDPILRSGFAMFISNNGGNQSELIKETRLLIATVSRAEKTIDNQKWDFITSMIIGELAISLVNKDFNLLDTRIHQNWQTCINGLFSETYSHEHIDIINQVFSENNLTTQQEISIPLDV